MTAARKPLPCRLRCPALPSPCQIPPLQPQPWIALKGLEVLLSRACFSPCTRRKARPGAGVSLEGKSIQQHPPGSPCSSDAHASLAQEPIGPFCPHAHQCQPPKAGPAPHWLQPLWVPIPLQTEQLAGPTSGTPQPSLLGSLTQNTPGLCHHSLLHGTCRQAQGQAAWQGLGPAAPLCPHTFPP